MPEDREGRQMFFQGAEFSVLDTCALFTLLFPALLQLCCVTVGNPIWLLKNLYRYKLGVKGEWLGGGIAEYCIPCLEGYTSPFTSPEEIIVSMCCFCP